MRKYIQDQQLVFEDNYTFPPEAIHSAGGSGLITHVLKTIHEKSILSDNYSINWTLTRFVETNELLVKPFDMSAFKGIFSYYNGSYHRHLIHLTRLQFLDLSAVLLVLLHNLFRNRLPLLLVENFVRHLAALFWRLLPLHLILIYFVI